MINDATLYLQAGSCECLAKTMAGVPTVLMNAYYGDDLGKGPLSRLEREKVERFMSNFDQVIIMQGCRIVEQWNPTERPSQEVIPE